MMNVDKRIHCTPAGPGSLPWREMLRQALDGRPWLIVTRTCGPQTVARDLLSELAGLPTLTEDVAEAESGRIADAAQRLYGLPISLACVENRREAVGLARSFVSAQKGAQALVQAPEALARAK